MRILWNVLGTAACTSAVYFLIELVKSWMSPEFKDDLERLREQRRLRKAARR